MNDITPTTARQVLWLRLQEVSAVLLSDTAGDAALRGAASGLHALCAAVIGVPRSSEAFAMSNGTLLACGLAIAPEDAARCVLDFHRTSRFLRGLVEAIQQAKVRFPGVAVHVLYAGCGPFAPLALPLTTRFSPQEVCFTLIDIHQPSLDAASRIFHAIGAGAWLRDRIRCDAATYSHQGPLPIHIVVAEAMQAALDKEPQAAITANLAPQLARGGTFVPEKITVSASLCNLHAEFTAQPGGPAEAGAAQTRRKLGTVLELTAAHSGPAQRRIVLPDDLDGDCYLALQTTVQVFGAIALADGESGLTRLKVLHELGKVSAGAAYAIAYEMGARPGFRVSPA